MDKATGPPCEPVTAHPPGHAVVAAPCPLPATEREAAPAPAPASSSSSCGGERPPLSGCPGLSSATGLPPGAAKVPQASAMKRSDPHHPQHRHRDGGDSGGAAAEALVSPDGTVTEAPRTVKKVTGRRRGGPGASTPHTHPPSTGQLPPQPHRDIPGGQTPPPSTPATHTPEEGGNRPGAASLRVGTVPAWGSPVRVDAVLVHPEVLPWDCCRGCVSGTRSSGGVGSCPLLGSPCISALWVSRGRTCKG